MDRAKSKSRTRHGVHMNSTSVQDKIQTSHAQTQHSRGTKLSIVVDALLTRKGDGSLRLYGLYAVILPS